MSMSHGVTATRLLLVAQAFASARGVSLARVSTLAGNDGKILPRLAAGRDCTTRTYDAMLAWFSSNWPEGAEWPAGVDRPEPAVAA
jgi:hypothetical protein